MAQERPSTPEKQLLSLIEGQAAKGSTSHDAQAIKYHGFGVFSAGAWLGRLSYFKAQMKKWAKGEETMHLEVAAVNQSLAVLLAGLIVYCAVNVYLSYSKIKRIQSVGLGLSLAPSSGKDAQETPSLKKPSSYYQEIAGQRDIFRMGAKKAAAEIKEPSSKTLELAQNLRLVGISWSEDPDAMIEDKKLSKTFFIKKGQLVGEARVKAISKDKITMEIDGEEFELR